MSSRLSYFLFMTCVLAAKASVGEATDYNSCKKHYQEDRSAKLDVKHIANTPEASWTPFEKNGVPGLGFSRSALWLRITCDNKEADILKPVTKLDYAFLDYVDAYKKTANDFSLVASTGDMIEGSGDFIHDRYPTIRLSLAPNALTTYYLRLATSGSLQAPLSIMSFSEYTKKSIRDAHWISFYYGILVCVLIYNLFIFFFTKKTVFLHYVLFVSSYCVFQLGSNGIMASFFKGYWFQNQGLTFFVLFIQAMILNFTNSYLRLASRNTLGTVNLSLRIISLALMIGAVLSTVIPYHYTAPVGALGAILVPLIAFTLSIHAASKNKAPFLLFALGWLAYLSGVLILGTKNLGYLEPSFFTNNAIQFGSAAEMILLSLAIGGQFSRLTNENEKVRRELLVSSSIAKTTQMLAHDIRKPFSTLRSMLKVLESTSSMAEIKKTIDIAKSQVQKSLISVEGMLTDVMEFGTKKELTQEPVSPRTLVKEVLEEVSFIHQNTDINLKFDFTHSNVLKVDKLRVHRLLSNILSNAVQAIANNGDKTKQIWIKTEDSQNKLIKITVGNTGSYIPKDRLNKVFDAFYTSGKASGTGLGLAISKKIADDHGGTIQVSSDEDRQSVEFKISLPSGDIKDIVGEVHLAERLTAYVPMNEQREQNTLHLAMINKLMDLNATKDNKIRIVLLDDDPIYREGVVSLAKGSELCELVTFTHFSSPDTILASDPSGWNYVISDLDLTHEKLDGYDVVKALVNDDRFKGACCIHSNNACFKDFQKATTVGAKAFYPKPMVLDHLLKFLLENAPRSFARQTRSETQAPKPTAAITVKPLIAFIDDDPFLRKVLVDQVDDAVTRVFATPEEFWDYAKDEINLAMLSAVVADNYFGELSNTEGTVFTKELREKFRGIIALYSDGDYSDSDLEHIDLVIPKGEIPTWTEISKRLKPATPAILRAMIKSKVLKKDECAGADRLLMKARHDLRSYLSRLEIVACMIDRGEQDDTKLREVLRHSLTMAAEYLSEQDIQDWRVPLEDPSIFNNPKNLIIWKDKQLKALAQDKYWSQI